MRILLTGASSFTGYWFANALHEAGHEVIATLTQPRKNYQGLRGIRVEALSESCKFEENCCFGSERFTSLLASKDKWDLLCHHGAVVTNYKSLDFDAASAHSANTRNLRSTLEALRGKGCKHILLTGSVFEQDEGMGDLPLKAFSPYGLSKGLTYQSFRHYSEMVEMHLGKFVIPNPFGPYEEPRFTHYLVDCWAKGKTPVVGAPDYVRDNIHVDLLANAYLQFAEKIRSKDSSAECSKCNPSGYVESQLTFARRFATAMEARLPHPCPVDFQIPDGYSEPMVRHNSKSAAQMVDGWNENGAWDNLAEYYLSLPKA